MVNVSEHGNVPRKRRVVHQSCEEFGRVLLLTGIQMFNLRLGDALLEDGEHLVVERLDQWLLDILCILLLYNDFGAFEHLWLLHAFHPYILCVRIVLFIFIKCDGVFVRPNGCILGLLLRF